MCISLLFSCGTKDCQTMECLCEALDILFQFCVHMSVHLSLYKVWCASVFLLLSNMDIHVPIIAELISTKL